MNRTTLLAACTKCGRELPREMFYTSQANRSGLRSNCKDCMRGQKVAHYAAHREELHAYYAAHAEEIRAKKAAHRAAHPEELQAYRAAHAEEIRAYRATHREEARAHGRNRKARKRAAGGSHTAADIRAQHKRQRGRCFYCSVKVGKAYHVDHVMPLARGGSNGPDNLVIACPFCNFSKGSKHPMDFAGVML